MVRRFQKELGERLCGVRSLSMRKLLFRTIFAWAVLLHPVWHWNIRSEEQLMCDAFPGEYEAYCAKTGRFFPKL